MRRVATLSYPEVERYIDWYDHPDVQRELGRNRPRLDPTIQMYIEFDGTVSVLFFLTGEVMQPDVPPRRHGVYVVNPVGPPRSYGPEATGEPATDASRKRSNKPPAAQDESARETDRRAKITEERRALMQRLRELELQEGSLSSSSTSALPITEARASVPQDLIEPVLRAAEALQDLARARATAVADERLHDMVPLWEGIAVPQHALLEQLKSQRAIGTMPGSYASVASPATIGPCARDIGDDYAPPKCPECASYMLIKHNSARTHYFWGCPGFPACRGTRNVPLTVQRALLSQSSTSSGSGSAVPAQAPIPPGPESRATKALKTAALQRELYERQLENGRLKPSARAQYAPESVDQQRACPHAFESLQWQGNQCAIYAACRTCGLKHVVYVERRGVHMNHQPSLQEEPPVSELHLVDMPPGYVMLDTGCKASVGGDKWHRALQTELVKSGAVFSEEPCTEYFKFGDGTTVASHRTWVYPLAIAGTVASVRIAEIPGDLPGLLSPEATGQFGLQVDFAQSKWRVPRGTWEPLQYTASGHIKLPVLQFPQDTHFADSDSDAVSSDESSADAPALDKARPWVEPADGSSASDTPVSAATSTSSEESQHDYSSGLVSYSTSSASE